MRCVTPASPGTSIGLGRQWQSGRSPSWPVPTRPCSLLPQQRTKPSRWRVHVTPETSVMTCATSDTPGTTRGVGPPGSTVPRPSRPWAFQPRQRSVPSLIRAHWWKSPSPDSSTTYGPSAAAASALGTSSSTTIGHLCMSTGTSAPASGELVSTTPTSAVPRSPTAPSPPAVRVAAHPATSANAAPHPPRRDLSIDLSGVSRLADRTPSPSTRSSPEIRRAIDNQRDGIFVRPVSAVGDAAAHPARGDVGADRGPPRVQNMRRQLRLHGRIGIMGWWHPRRSRYSMRSPGTHARSPLSPEPSSSQRESGALASTQASTRRATGG